MSLKGATGNHVGSVQQSSTAVPHREFAVTGIASEIKRNHMHQSYTAWGDRGYHTGRVVFGSSLNNPKHRSADPLIRTLLLPL